MAVSPRARMMRGRGDYRAFPASEGDKLVSFNFRRLSLKLERTFAAARSHHVVLFVEV